MIYLKIGISFASAFILAFIMFKVFIPVLRKVKLGQKILDIGPNWHKCKEGTPTMGGLFFITAMLLTLLGLYIGGAFDGISIFFSINLCFALLNGAIGFIDDYVKLFKKSNEGLSPMQKLALQAITTGAYLAALKLTDCIDTFMPIPFTDNYIDFGVFYYIIVGVVIVYIINTANLTDGLDGLAGSVGFVIAVLFVLIGLREDITDMYLTEATLCGAIVAFLVFNMHPAKVFMGDTGSLFLGAMLVGCAMRMGRPLLMVLIGIVYVIEGVSVMIQVSVFKLTHGKKRFFKMAPIHHHFELCGFSEVQIVAVWLTVTVLFSALAYYLYTVL